MTGDGAGASAASWPTSPPRLIATDLDGTLLRGDGTLSARTRAALLAVEQVGIGVVFVTARPPRWVDELADAVGGHGVAICANGAAVYDVRRREVLAERGMAPEVVRVLVAELRAGLDGAAFALERAGGFASETHYRHVHPRPPTSPVAAQIEDLLTGSTFKLLVRADGLPTPVLLRTSAALLGVRAIVADSGASGLAEISGAGVTKASTLADWCARRGVAAADVWAFGDAPNDLDMLAWAGVSYAVANARPEVQSLASHGCASNDDDGVARVLEHALELEDASRRS